MLTTAASLFNRLRIRLDEMPDALIAVNSSESVGNLVSSSLAEIQGEVIGNPLKQVLDLLAAIGPYFGLQIDEPDADSAGLQSASFT